ncbi:CIC11C00000001317 [Sungouiella intermedia]|uniref:CIC11C00000001317 n=1 Tax=Sungouiella intermedia TaxID=45354 RepID=A0A1L0C2D5_9ASCO|nr:CIC11C00000001317 [[Candida] intermedia]
MKEDSEVQPILPQYSEQYASAPVASSSQLAQPTRTKVRFMFKKSKPRPWGLIKYEDGVFVFEANATIQQAAEYAASNYPDSKEVPTFNNVWGFFKEAAPTSQIVVIDPNANVHSMFREDDILIVSNVPNIKNVQRMEMTYQILLALSLPIALFLFTILMIVLHG